MNLPTDYGTLILTLTDNERAVISGNLKINKVDCSLRFNLSWTIAGGNRWRMKHCCLCRNDNGQPPSESAQQKIIALCESLANEKITPDLRWPARLCSKGLNNRQYNR